jgi:hypothetical protein
MVPSTREIFIAWGRRAGIVTGAALVHAPALNGITSRNVHRAPVIQTVKQIV